MKIKLNQLRKIISEEIAIAQSPERNLDGLVKMSQRLAVNFVSMDREDIRDLASGIYEELEWLNKNYDLVPKQKS